MQMVGFEAPFRCRRLIEQPLEDAAGNAHHAFIFTGADAEFDGVPVGIPPGVLGECEKRPRPPLEALDTTFANVHKGSADLSSVDAFSRERDRTFPYRARQRPLTGWKL
jgi:hypothetical protein